MSFRINQLIGDSGTPISYLNQGLSDIRYINQNFEETLEFDLNMSNHRIKNLAPPIDIGDVTTKQYVDTKNTENRTYTDEQVLPIFNTLSDTRVIVSNHTTDIHDLNNDIINLENSDTAIGTRITALESNNTTADYNNYLTARFYAQTGAGNWVFAWFLTYDYIHQAGDITCITTQYDNQIGFKIGTTSACANYLLSGMALTERRLYIKIKKT